MFCHSDEKLTKVGFLPPWDGCLILKPSRRLQPHHRNQWDLTGSDFCLHGYFPFSSVMDRNTTCGDPAPQSRAAQPGGCLSSPMPNTWKDEGPKPKSVSLDRTLAASWLLFNWLAVKGIRKRGVFALAVRGLPYQEPVDVTC